MAESGTGPINVADYERLASEALDAGPLGYFSGGAWDEVTLRENVDAWRRWRLRPRMLVDVGEMSTATELLGAEVSMPIVVAPVAFQRMAHDDGEAGMARAAAEAGALMCLSTIATARPSEVAAAAPQGHRWFQLYCFRDRAVTQTLIDEAVEFGYEAIVLTVDAPRLGWRERDLRSGFVVPASVTVPSVAAALGADKPIGVAEA
ncbi:MAG: alpha-hydroxy-acid oxidizing protein, partial [Actinomycetota bacterium]|nr:alpha-hydroxy-acid oxidizing protein [Actinomycetota bacterium]